MAKYKAVFDDSQASVLNSFANDMGSYESRLKAISNSIDSRDRSMATLQSQVKTTAAALPAIATRLRREGETWRQSVAVYKRAETNAGNSLEGKLLQSRTISDIIAEWIKIFFTKFPSLGPVITVPKIYTPPWWPKYIIPMPNQPKISPAPKPPSIQPPPVTPPKAPIFPGTINTYSVFNPNFKQYATEGEYSGYSVLNGFDPAYCYCQHNYSKFVNEKTGKNVGCTAAAEAIVVSIAKGKTISPDEMGWGGQGVWATWKNSNAIPGSADQSQAERLKTIGEQLVQGNAVVVRANANHSVAAIGIRGGADLANLSPSDILIVDPATGKVTTLDKAVSGGCNMPTGSWPLRLAN